MSSTPFPASTSAPGPSLIEEVSSLDSDIESCDAPNTVPLGHSVYLSKACKMLIRMLSKSAETDRAPSSYDVLTWMDAENSEVDGLYMHSFSDFQTFKIKDALSIMGTRVHVLASFGYLGRGGALRLRQCMRDRVLILLGLWTMTTDSIGTVEKPLDIKRLFQWRNEVEEDYIEEFEELSGGKVEEVEEVEEIMRTDSSGIEEVEGWTENLNWGQWEEEI